MMPTIGRIVLYTLCEGWWDIGGARTFPAIITKVHEGAEARVNLRAFLDADPKRPNELNEWFEEVPFNERHGVSGTWSWPPRE